MDTITKFDDSSLKVEREAVVQSNIFTVADIEAQIKQCLESKKILDEHIAYYQTLLDKAGEFSLMTEETIEEQVAEEAPVEIKK